MRSVLRLQFEILLYQEVATEYGCRERTYGTARNVSLRTIFRIRCRSFIPTGRIPMEEGLQLRSTLRTLVHILCSL